MDENPYRAPSMKNGPLGKQYEPAGKAWYVAAVPYVIILLLAPFCLASLFLHHVTFVERPPAKLYFAIDGTTACLAIAGFFIAVAYFPTKST